MHPITKFGRVAIGDFLGKDQPIAPEEDHLLAAEAWLCRAQDASADGGVSYGYSLRGGWRPSYPETSGYIATTFFRLAQNRNPVYAERAHRILRWLDHNSKCRWVLCKSSLRQERHCLRHGPSIVRPGSRLRAKWRPQPSCKRAPGSGMAYENR